jgi:hypothetical protein
MKITITPTAELAAVNGAPVRVWDGVTEGGDKVTVYVALLKVPPGKGQVELDAAVKDGKIIEVFPSVAEQFGFPAPIGPGRKVD